MTSQNTLNPEGRRSQARHLVLVDDLGLHGLHADEYPRVFQVADKDYLSLRAIIPLLGSSTEDVPPHPPTPTPFVNGINQNVLDLRLMNMHACLLCDYDSSFQRVSIQRLVPSSEDALPTFPHPLPLSPLILFHCYRIE